MRPSELPSDPDQLPLAVNHPADGRALRYHFDEFMLSWVASLSGAVSRYPMFETAARHFGREMLELHVEHALYRELLDVGRAYVRRAYLKSAGLPYDKPVACPAELHELVDRHSPDSSVPLVAVGAIGGRLRRMAHTRHRLMDAIRRYTMTPPPPAARSMVAVELVEGSDPAGKSDAFWLAGNTIDPARVLFILEFHNRPLLSIEQEISTIERLGARAVALHPAMSAGGRIPVWIMPRPLNYAAALRAGLAAPRSPIERWLRRLLVNFAERVGYWEAFFGHFAVAVYQHFTELDPPDIVTRRLAMERVGGIEIGKMRSQFFERASPAFHFLHEIAMVWNANVRRDLEYSRTRTRELVEVGYPWDHLLSSKAGEAQALRRRFERAGARYVVTIYDNHPHLNGHFESAHVERFYRHLVAVARANRDVGLIVKSKKPQVLDLFPAVRAALGELERDGRCVVIDEPLTSIAVSALAADLVVAVPASSAACEAAIGGRRILMYDPGNCRDHPFAGKDKGLIYPDFEAFQRAVDRCIDGSAPPACGNATPYLPDIDPYRDGQSHYRAAAFIKGYLQARDAGLPKPDALARARACYQKVTRATDGA